MSLSNEDIREISNPGASGSLFFLSNDDMFIVKTVQHKEATFLQQLLPGYYMVSRTVIIVSTLSHMSSFNEMFVRTCFLQMFSSNLD